MIGQNFICHTQNSWLLSVATKGAVQPQASSATIQPDSIHRPTPRLSELALPTGVPSPTELPYDGSIPFYLPGTALSPPKDSPADEDSPQASNSSHTPTVAQPILTKEQRKANHVDSEKRRRAGIRQSYEALCLIVPSLREAMDEEEADIQKSKKGKKAEEADNKPSKRLTKGQVSKSEGIVLQHSQSTLFAPPFVH